MSILNFIRKEQVGGRLIAMHAHEGGKRQIHRTECKAGHAQCDGRSVSKSGDLSCGAGKKTI